MKTAPHLSTNMGLRGHSVGSHYPYIVVAKGDPHGELVWGVLLPCGQHSAATFPTCSQAIAHAAALHSISHVRVAS